MSIQDSQSAYRGPPALLRVPVRRAVRPDASSVCSELAADISLEDGLIWKVWTEDAGRGRAGGVYLFTDEALAERYAVKHPARLGSFGITGIAHRSIGVQDALSEITRANLG